MRNFLFVLIAMFVFNSCGRIAEALDDIQIQPKSVKMHYDEKVPFSATINGKGVSVDYFFTWTSTDPGVGGFSSDVFYAKRIGKTTLTATHKESGKTYKSEVEVVPYYTFFTEPVTDGFGKTKDEVKALEKRNIISENSSSIVYDANIKEAKAIEYGFDATGKLNKITVEFTQPYNKEVQTFYLEKYAGKTNRSNVFYEKDLFVGIYASADVNPHYKVIYSKDASIF